MIFCEGRDLTIGWVNDHEVLKLHQKEANLVVAEESDIFGAPLLAK